MNKDKTYAKKAIAAIRGLFASEEPKPTAQTAEPQQGAFAGATAAYNVQGGVPVYVDISDDNIPDIDQGDNVYADATGTTQYPDGTYTVDGTGFSFTVVAGTVTLIADATGAGPGLPIPTAPAQAAPVMSAPAPQPAPQQAPQPAPQQAPQQAPAMQPRFASILPATFAAFKTSFGSDTTESVKLNPEEAYTDMLTLISKFATGTVDERLAAVETMVKALMQYAYGYEIQRIDQQTAINTYKTSVESLQAETQKQAAQIGHYKEAGEKLTTLFEEFLAIPSAEPIAVNEKEKQRIEKEAKKETRLQHISEALKEYKK